MRRVRGAELSDIVSKTIEVYNKYRSPEATASLPTLQQESFTIEFEGSFCLTCGIQDYFEGFIYELKDLDSEIDVEIERVEQTGPSSFKVHYIVKALASDDTPPTEDVKGRC